MMTAFAPTPPHRPSPPRARPAVAIRILEPNAGHRARAPEGKAGPPLALSITGPLDPALIHRSLIEAQEVERRRIARELHDVVGQALTAVKLRLEAARLSGDPGEVAAQVDEAVGIVDQVLGQVRGFALELRPAVLDDLGLAPALRWHLDRLARGAGFRGRLVSSELVQRFHPEVETACFRVAQEALTNVARHAHASRVTVELRVRADDLDLWIRDDGVGFDVRAALVRAASGESMGLTTMRERVQLLGGEIEIASAAGRGTRLRARFPNAAQPTSQPVV